jgi:rSAM/selenodomain-associated transferase 1
MKRPILVIIAKQPQVGITKTRLSPPLTLAAAAELFEALLLDTIDLASSISGLDLAVAVTPPDSIPYFERVTPPGTLLLPVTCPDIGDCLTQVFDRLFQLDYPQVLAFNSDGPSLPVEYIQQALQLLADHDVVFGPSEDGGYYLVGLENHIPQLFGDIAWSTPEVLSQSLAKASADDLRVSLLPDWYDVDTEAGLKRLLEDTRSLPDQRLVHSRRFFAGLPTELISALSDQEPT